MLGWGNDALLGRVLISREDQTDFCLSTKNDSSRRYLDDRSGRMKYDIEALAGSRRNSS